MWRPSVIKVGVVNMDVCISSHLKVELAWAVDKWFRVVNTIMLFKNSKNTKELKELAILNLKQYCICCYVAYTLLCGP